MRSRRRRQDTDNRLRDRRLAERVLVDGRLVAAVESWRHGNRDTYGKWGCRCVPCTRAEREYRAGYRAERGAA